MPCLGREGIIELQREAPCPVVLPASALDRTNNRLLVNSDSLWPCEAVILVGKSAGIATSIAGYLHKDSLDRVTLHSTLDGAANNDAATRISLASLEQRATILFAANQVAQTTYVLSFYTGNLLSSDSTVQSEMTLADWPSAENAYYAAGSRFVDWKIAANIRSWTLTTGAAAIDTSVIGEKFSEAIKSTVTGSGTFDFVIDLFGSNNEFSPETLIRLVLMTERGGAGNARFYLRKDKTQTENPLQGRVNGRSPIRSAVCYSASILLVNSVIDTSADGIVQGSADYVTTGPIKLGIEAIGE